MAHRILDALTFLLIIALCWKGEVKFGGNFLDYLIVGGVVVALAYLGLRAAGKFYSE